LGNLCSNPFFGVNVSQNYLLKYIFSGDSRTENVGAKKKVGGQHRSILHRDVPSFCRSICYE